MLVPADRRTSASPPLPDGYFAADRPSAGPGPRRLSVRPSRARRVLVLLGAAAVAAAAFYAGGRYDVEAVSPGSSAPVVYFVDRWSSRVWLCEPPALGHPSPVCRRVPGPPPFGR